MHRHLVRIAFCLASFACAVALQAQEICDNGVDDDLDGLIDINDTTDCRCLIGSFGGSGSLIPNPSFEEQDCVPSDFSQLGCATGWEQATTATSDYFSTNGFMAFWCIDPPDGIGMGGAYGMPDWQEYLGACLLEPMLTGETYSITFDITVACVGTPTVLGPIDITIFGLGSCPTFPLNTVACPVPEGWSELGHATYNPDPAWSELTITFTPTFDVQAMILGSPCDLPPEYSVSASPYFSFDDLQLAERVDIHLALADTGSFCTNNRALVAHPDTVLGSYQWYQD
ncbi:MAG TPA: hypothetical protein VHL57_11010, partial [Flavobacteriales bacterium]|nr:hypothetical protein [Flavobacteriales bacterium]